MRKPHVPAALRWLVAAVALCGTAWALLVPAWQVPDEDAHFAYVQTLVELGRRPADDGRSAEKSTEQYLAEQASGFLDSVQRLEERPEWSPAAERRWRARERTLSRAAREDGGGALSSRGNPPGYYLYAMVPYLAARRGTVLDRLYLMRLFSVPLTMLFAVSGWLLAGELLGRDRCAQLAAGALCGLAPMAGFIGGGVTPDALLFPLWGFALWLSMRVLRRRARMVDLAFLAAVLLAALAVKPVSAALLPGVVWAMGAGLWRRSGRPPVSARSVAAVVGALAFSASVAAALLVPGGPRRFASYLWQFYSPVDAGAQPVRQLPAWPLRDIWWEGTVGAFGWLEVRFPGWVYAAVAAVAALVVVGAGRALIAAGPRRHAATSLALALPALTLLAGLHLTEEWLLVEQGEGFSQGRYLLPLLPLAGLALGASIRACRSDRRGIALGAALGVLSATQLASLAIVTARFYA